MRISNAVIASIIVSSSSVFCQSNAAGQFLDVSKHLSCVRVSYGNGAGSGSFIGYNGPSAVIATAAHVVGPVGSVAEVTFTEGIRDIATVTGWVEYSDSRSDFAVVYLRRDAVPKSADPIRVDRRPTRTGDTVSFVGFANGHGRCHYLATVTAALNRQGTANTQPTYGTSGGPVIRNGRLVGVVSGFRNDTRQLIFAPLPSSWLLKD